MLLTVGKWYQVYGFNSFGTEGGYAKCALGIALAQGQELESTSRREPEIT